MFAIPVVGFTREGLLAEPRARIIPAGLLCPPHRVDALPKDAVGKLPREALRSLARACARQGRRR